LKLWVLNFWEHDYVHFFFMFRAFASVVCYSYPRWRFDVLIVITEEYCLQGWDIVV